MIIIRAIYTFWILNYSFIEKSFKKDPHWSDRDSSIGAAAFGNLIMLFLVLFYHFEKLVDSWKIKELFSINFPLYAIGVIGSFVVLIFFSFLFSFLKSSDKKQSYRAAINLTRSLNRSTTIVTRIIIFLLFLYTLRSIGNDMFG